MRVSVGATLEFSQEWCKLSSHRDETGVKKMCLSGV
jgi:hypothetical protein